VDKIVECVPNFSEGRDASVWEAISEAVSSVKDVLLLDVDPDASYNRVVVTFAGSPEAVVEAAFKAAKVAGERIDMSRHKGEHPRFGAMDVCPFVPVAGVSMADCAELARAFGKRVGEELGYPIYLYEAAAGRPERKNLAVVRSGQYEGLKDKLKDPEWKPDFGPAEFVPHYGVTAAGARFFLIAYNVDLATADVELSQRVADAVRQMGGPLRDDDGNVVTRDGKPVKRKGKLRMVKGMGVFLEPKDRPPFCQISMNLTNYLITPPHVAFEEVKYEAAKLGVETTGSEVVGLVPLEPLLLAAEYYVAESGERKKSITEEELVQVACDRLGLSDYNSFDPEMKIIERRIAGAGW
jgi:glutamate formiminotransferase/formiminotetrahydrofolate cyclodeaminase